MLKQGDTLGRYTIRGLIGKGGWGEVYEAVDPELDRQVALKLLPHRHALNPAMQERFAREARTVAALDHPNIVTIHSVEEADGQRFITMQLVRGRTLAQLIPANGMPMGDLLRVAIPLVEAIAAAHAKGVTHRDLKPANVMVADDGQVKVLDFGLAKLIPPDDGATLESGPTLTGTVIGTLNYMSPEQLRGEEADHRSDLFSLGVMLYEMATGTLPFKGKSSIEVAASILRDRPAGLTDGSRGLPRHLGRIIHICLHEEPGRRFQSALDVRNQLRNLRDELETGKAEVAAVSQTRVPKSRRRLAVAAAALALLAVIGAFFIARNTKGPTGPPATPTPADTSRIVVLPFEDLGQPAVDYFAPGLTEEISSRLAAVDGLGVISRISADQYAGSAKTARQIGDELQVAYILRGSVQWAANGSGPSRVRILPNLIRVEDDTQIWTEPYEGSVDDIFQVQSEIAASVAAQLGSRLAGSGPEEAAKDRPTPSLEAYQAYLRGLHFARRPVYTLENWSLAVEGFSDAVETDPDFAFAWAWLARAHSIIIHLGLDITDERRQLALRAIERAIELSPETPEIRLAQGYYHYWAEKDYDLALSQFAVAESRLPDHYEVLEGKGYVLRRQGRWAEAVASLEEAFELNPRDAAMAAEVAEAHTSRRNYDEAIRWYDRSIALDPEQVWAYASKASAVRLRDGDLAAARATLEKMPPSDDTQAAWAWFWQEYYEGEPELAMARLTPDLGPWLQSWEWTEPAALLRAQAQELAGDLAGARDSYLLAEELLRGELARQPDDARRLSSLGLALAGLGRDEDAIHHARRATELMPISRDAMAGASHLADLALVYTRTGRHEEALATTAELLSQPSLISPPLLRLDPRWRPLAAEASSGQLASESG
jgi:serine/threonine-protein kinase